MKLFEYKNYKLQVSDEALTLKPFKVLHDRDTSEGKERVFKELAFIYHFADIRSDFLIINDEDERKKEVAVQVDLPEDWTPDAEVQVAIDFYKERTISPTMALYLNAVKAALDTGEYLANAKVLLAERDMKGAIVVQPSVITSSLNNINKTIRDLKAAEKEVIKELKDTEGRMKGSQTMSYFEDGFAN